MRVQTPGPSLAPTEFGSTQDQTVACASRSRNVAISARFPYVELCEPKLPDPPQEAIIPARAAAAPGAVHLLVEQVNRRLDELGLTKQRAAYLGVVSRSTLQTLGQDGAAPTARTLGKFDELLAWQDGSAAAVLMGGEPTPMPSLWMVENLRKHVLASAEDAGVSVDDPRIVNIGHSGRVPRLEELAELERLMRWAPGAAVAAMRDESPQLIRHDPKTGESQADPRRLGDYLDARLAEMGLTRASAAQMTDVSYPTLQGLGQTNTVPRPRTLARIDQLLAWAPGSAERIMHGGEPEALEPSARWQDEAETLDPKLLIPAIEARLPELGLNTSKAAELGRLSRATLETFGKDGKMPRDSTLAEVDQICSWEPGSAKAVMRGGEATPREAALLPSATPIGGDRPMDNYANLNRHIEIRLRELNLTRTKFAALGGPARTTIFQIGRRGTGLAEETLDRLDTTLLWKPGSTANVLRGGVPTPLGSASAPHASLIPLNAALTQLRRLLARYDRMEKSIEVMRVDTEAAIRQVGLAMTELGAENVALGQDVLDDESENR